MKKLLPVAIVLMFASFAPIAFAAPFIYVANAGEDTVSKIDIATNTEVARYATWFTSGPHHITHPNCPYTPNASLGAVWNPPTFQDRAHHGPGPSRIARDTAGNIFVLNRFFSNAIPNNCSTNPPHLPVLLKLTATPGSPTSTNSTPLAITDSNNSNDIDTGEAADKAILWAKPIGYTINGDDTGLGRALAVDKSGALWVGMYLKGGYYKVDSNSGAMITPAGSMIATSGHSPYGAQIDKNGMLWSVDEKSSLAKIDTTASSPTATVLPYNGNNYSLAVYNGCDNTPVRVYISQRLVSPKVPYVVYDPQTSQFCTTSGLPAMDSVAIGVDSHGDVISGEWLNTGKIIKTRVTGTPPNLTATVVWTATVPSGATIEDLHGIIVDDNDDIWAVDYHRNRVIKYSSSGTYVATVPVGDQPYTYGNPPPPTCSGSATPTPTPTPTPTVTPTPTPSGCGQVTAEGHCQPDGSYSYNLNVTNNSPNAASQILLTAVQGSTFTLAPQLKNLSSPLQSGQSTSVTMTISRVKPGDKVCFFVSLMSDQNPCCIVQVCPDLPKCGEVSPTPSVTPTLPPPRSRQQSRGRRRP